jgi:hypothetical protein
MIDTFLVSHSFHTLYARKVRGFFLRAFWHQLCFLDQRISQTDYRRLRNSAPSGDFPALLVIHSQ